VEVTYSLYEMECLNVVCYLHGSLFTLVTDHQAIKFLMKSYQLTRKLNKWAFYLARV
jgi:hypothetical protein